MEEWVLKFGIFWVLLAGVIFPLSGILKHNEKKKEFEKNRLEKKREAEKLDQEQNTLQSLILEHFEALKMNHEKSIYIDEYGTKHFDKWEKELTRFLKSVGYKSDTYTGSSIAVLTAKFIEEHSKELEEAQ